MVVSEIHMERVFLSEVENLLLGGELNQVVD